MLNCTHYKAGSLKCKARSARLPIPSGAEYIFLHKRGPTENISWTDSVKNEEILHRDKEERNILHVISQKG